MDKKLLKTFNSPKIIAMTANAYVEDIENSLKAGMNAHLGKPVEPEMLYKTLSENIFYDII